MGNSTDDFEMVCPECGYEYMEPNGGTEFICPECGYTCDVPAD